VFENDLVELDTAGNRSAISLTPVIDLPAGHIAVDSYEIPASLREQLLLCSPADVFPYATRVSRSIDVDHTIPYLGLDRGGPPGQTRIGNLGPHVRRNHRLRTMVAGRFGNPNPHLAMAITPQPHLPRQRLRHPSSRQHRLRRENLARRGEPNASDGELAQVCLAVLAVVEFVDSLCCGLPTCGPARLREGRSCSQPILRPEISVPNLGRL
jgi:hypothetical protein